MQYVLQSQNTKVTNTQLKISYSKHNVTYRLPYCLLSTPMGVDYVVIGFDMEVQPLVTHNAA